MLSISAVLGMAIMAQGQMPEPYGTPATTSYVAAPAAPALPPLFHVRLDGPAGMKVTIFRGGQRGQVLAAPVTIGLRPGYGYRLALSDVPGFPAQVFYPALEVRGTLLLASQLRHADFPATLTFSVDDFARVQAGALVKKAVVLERPDRALPAASKVESPLEVPVASLQDPLIEGRNLGQPLAVLHMGQRQLGPDELRGQGVPGTILLPGEKVIGPPAVAPWIVWQWCPVYDPILGGEDPANFMTIHDGGALSVGLDRRGKLRGVEPSDTVAEYVDARGRKRVVASNRVSLCVPRFVILRSETLLAEQVVRQGPGSAQVYTGRGELTGQQGLQKDSLQQRAEGIGQQQRLAGTALGYGTAIVGRMDGAKLYSSLRGTGVVDGQCQRPEEERPELPLLIIKWPDKCGVLIGDLVTFSLKYTNRGSRPITDVVVTNSLAPRFEYVPSSAKTDRPASLTTQPNRAGSLLLRWEVSEALPPGESGLITFQVRVR